MKNRNFNKVLELEKLARSIHETKYGDPKNGTKRQFSECRKLAAIQLGLITL
jgi:hypothetical protein